MQNKGVFLAKKNHWDDENYMTKYVIMEELRFLN